MTPDKLQSELTGHLKYMQTSLPYKVQSVHSPCDLIAMIFFEIISFMLCKNIKLLNLILGTWLAPLQVNRVHDYRFDTEYRSRGCNNLHIVSHKQSTSDMYQKHAQLKENGKLCLQETHLHNSFIYNWDLPPTQCCKRISGIP